MAGVLKQFTIVQENEAAVIRQGANVEWFQHLMDGRMLIMPQRPTLSKPMQTAMEVANYRMRSRTAEERGFYIWMESKNVPQDQFPTDEEVVTTEATEATDFDPLNDVI
jgi:hypothetical protein